MQWHGSARVQPSGDRGTAAVRSAAVAAARWTLPFALTRATLRVLHSRHSELPRYCRGPLEHDRPDAHKYLAQIRKLLLDGRNVEAEELVNQHFVGKDQGLVYYHQLQQTGKWCDKKVALH